MKIDGLDLKKAAIELLYQTSSNAYRRAFGLGHIVTSLGVTIAPFVAAKASGNNSGWVAFGCDSVIVIALLSGVARNRPKIVETAKYLLFEMEFAGPIPTPEEMDRVGSPRSINIEYAHCIARRLGTRRPTVGRVFCAGLWNGIKHNGLMAIYQMAVGIIALSATFTCAATEQFSTIYKASRLEKQGIDPSEATQKEFVKVFEKYADIIEPSVERILPYHMQRNRNEAINSVIQVMQQRQAEGHLLPPP
jgi:hypothetical protein